MEADLLLIPASLVFAFYLVLAVATVWIVWRPRVACIVGATIGWTAVDLLGPLFVGSHFWLSGSDSIAMVVVFGWPLVASYSLVVCLFWPSPWRFVVPGIAACGLAIGLVRTTLFFLSLGPIGGPG